MEKFIQVITTTETNSDAEKIANHVLDSRLAGCIQVIGPIKSHFWWKGKKENAEEYVCLIKTKASLYPELEKAIRQVHPYENPEILATDILEGSKLYLDWLSKETK